MFDVRVMLVTSGLARAVFNSSSEPTLTSSPGSGGSGSGSFQSPTTSLEREVSLNQQMAGFIRIAIPNLR